MALGSLTILMMDHERVTSSLETTLAATDNVTQARLRVTRALLDFERLRSGDPTLPASQPVAEVDEAIALLDDLRAGRSSLLGVAPRTLEPRLDSLARAFVEELQTLRGAFAGGTAGDTRLDGRLRAARVEAAANSLEREVYDTFRRELAAEDVRHRLRVAAWIVVLLGAGAAFFAARIARDRSEAALHVVERQYAALATHAAAGLVRVDRRGRVLESTNGWGTLLFSGGRFWWEALAGGDGTRASELWATRSSRLDTFFLEVRHDGVDGSTQWFGSRWVRDRKNPEGDESWVGTFIDETEHRVVEDQLRQAQRLESVGQLTSAIAHDFNNFLAVIASNVELLKLDRRVGRHGLELVAEIEAATRGGRDLVNGLTGFSRKASLDMDAQDLGDAIRASARLARRLLPESIQMTVHMPDSPRFVHADRRALQQILLNLVSNARDAMPDGGTLRVEVDAIDVDEAYVDAHPWVELGSFGRITVTDTGTGMDAATLARVFDPFFTTKDEGKGTGLGLATVHGLVRQHGGHAHAYSEPGVGTTFRIYIPAASAEGKALGVGPPRATPAANPPPDARRPSLRILLVDDDEVLRRTAARLLVRLGHEVAEASSGREALEILEDGDGFDVIISDVTMENMGGMELFETLRARGRVGGFVFTSGRSVEEVTARGVLPDGTVYLAKPWTMEELERAIESAGSDPLAAEGSG